MLRFMYTTDLHGNVPKYEEALKQCKDYGLKILHIGADILPKGSGILSLQKKFINGYLREFYKRCQDVGITVLAFFGNDDIYTRKKYFKKYGRLLDEEPRDLEGYTFSAYGYVPDYPFTLKTACKIDYDGWTCPDAYLGPPVDVGEEGTLTEIQDINTYFKKKSTIETDLKALKGGERAIVATHCPPQGVNLDVCYANRRVGSKAVYDWVEREQPLILLCGHIHESLKCSGEWKAYIGQTMVIQPGQDDRSARCRYVVIEVDGGKPTAVLFNGKVH